MCSYRAIESWVIPQCEICRCEVGMVITDSVRPLQVFVVCRRREPLALRCSSLLGPSHSDFPNHFRLLAISFRRLDMHHSYALVKNLKLFQPLANPWLPRVVAASCGAHETCTGAGPPSYRRKGELTTHVNSKQKLLPWAVFESYLDEG